MRPIGGAGWIIDDEDSRYQFRLRSEREECDKDRASPETRQSTHPLHWAAAGSLMCSLRSDFGREIKACKLQALLQFGLWAGKERETAMKMRRTVHSGSLASVPQPTSREE